MHTMKSLRTKRFCRRRSYHVEVLLDNLVDKDVQSLLLPLNLMQIIIAYPKYDIRDNFITPNSSRTIFISFCITIVNVVTLFYRGTELYLQKNHSSAAYINFILDYFFFSIGYFINFMGSVLYTDANISFILTFQEIHRYLNDKTNFKGFVIGNWVSVILVVGAHLLIGFYLAMWLKKCRLLFYIMILVSFDANIVYAIRLIRLLTEKVHLWNKAASNLQRTGEIGTEAYGKIFHAYVHILDCYDIYKISLQQTVAYHAIELFFHAMIHLQIAIVNLKKCAVSGQFYLFYVQLFALNIWLIKTITIHIFLSIHCQKFYIAMKNTQHTCAVILKRNCTEGEKRLCKNIIRLYRARFDKMKACSMFYVDGTLPVKLMALLTNYTVVLLQFAFL